MKGSTILSPNSYRMRTTSLKVGFAALTAMVSMLGPSRWGLAATLTAGACQSGGYASIQQAVNAAKTGDTVQVCPGSWHELVEVFRKNITLTGLGKGEGRPTLFYPTDVDHICLDGEDCPQILVKGSPATTVENLQLDGAGFQGPVCNDPIGIMFQDSGGTATGNTIVNHSHACASSPTLPTLVGDGIDVVYTKAISAPDAPFSVAITNNTLNSFAIYGISVDAFLLPGGSLVDGPLSGPIPSVDLTGSITGNTQVSTSSSPQVQHIGVQGTDNFRIAANNLTSDEGNGISVQFANDPTVTDNTLDKMNLSIDVAQSSFATVNFNKITDAAGLGGIWFTCTSRSSIAFNTIDGIFEDGAYFGGEGGIALFADCSNPQDKGSDHDTIVLNTIDGFCSGILTGPATDTDDNLVANAYENIGPGQDVMPGDGCH